MTELFLKLLNMSITAGWIVLAVIVLRFFLRKAPKWISCILWSVVALRLLLPFSLESAISLIPSPEVIPQDIAVSETPAIHSAIPALNNAVNPLFTGYVAPGGSLLENCLIVVSAVWIAGVAMMLLYSILTYLEIRRQVRESIPYQKNIYVCDDVDSPFILGIFRPKIYIPSGMEETHLAYVLAHENAHLKRWDHWWKPLGFLLLTVYWFNPLLWVAYILLCRDIEMACDEKVIGGMDGAGKRGYSEALIACSVHRRMVMACPVAFGEVSVKTRIKSVLRYKKPALWVALAALAVCVLTAGCFLTNPVPCEHAYQSQVLLNATCTSRGVEKRTCPLCEHSYTAYVAKCAHSYDKGVVTIEPTCVRFGSQKQVCTHCGKVNRTRLGKVPHTVSEPYYIQESNCTERGNKSATCAVCKEVFVVEQLATNDVHDMKEMVLLQPTCTATGEGVNTCTRCSHSESISYEIIDHSYRVISETQATCTSAGTCQKVCTACGYEVQETLPQLGHYWVRDGYKDHCQRCGMSIFNETISEITSRPIDIGGFSSGNNPGSSPLDGVVGSPPKTPDDLFPVIRWDPYPY